MVPDAPDISDKFRSVCVRRDDRWIQLYGGAPFWPLNPEGCAIGIYTIAHALSCTPRFNGHTIEPYSVAQHSVLVSHHCLPEHALYGLLHDASEAVLHDIVRPVKAAFSIDGRPYAEIEDRILTVIFRQFDLSMPIPDDVHHADNRLLVTEQRDLMHPSHIPWHKIHADPLTEVIVPWSWQAARTAFLNRFNDLTQSKYT